MEEEMICKLHQKKKEREYRINKKTELKIKHHPSRRFNAKSEKKRLRRNNLRYEC